MEMPMKIDPLKAYLEEIIYLPDFTGFSSIEVNSVGFFGTTPLDVAACRGDHEVMRLLLDAGAEINLSDIDQCTPLHQATLHGHGKCVSLLLERGALPDLKNRDGQTALDIAILLDNSALITLLHVGR